MRRRWIDEQAYAHLVGLCQFLPGPASSQVGFSIGLMRAGYRGGLAAWTGFTLPSAIALVLFAYGAGELSGPVGIGLLHGLKLVAVAIVAQAVWGMAHTLCPDRERASIAAVVALIILFSSSSTSQIAGILLGGVGDMAVPRRAADNDRACHSAGFAHRRPGGARRVLSSARGSSDLAWFAKHTRSGPFRSIIPLGCTGYLAVAMWCCRCCAKPL